MGLLRYKQPLIVGEPETDELKWNEELIEHPNKCYDTILVHYHMCNCVRCAKRRPLWEGRKPLMRSEKRPDEEKRKKARAKRKRKSR